MKSDKELKADVEAELSWEPAIDAAHVGVAASGGIVTLTGHLNTYAEKAAIERVVSRVAGVRGVAVELDVKIPSRDTRSDTELAQAAQSALAWNVVVPSDKVRVKAEKGWLTLSGELDWEYQRNAAATAVRPLKGVIGVTNSITIKPRAVASDIGTRIGAALSRHAWREANAIRVNVNGSTVTLRGKIDSLAERNAAEGAAWSAPGVTAVVSELTVG